MRVRMTLLAAGMAAVLLAAMPAAASAHPQHNRGLTIHLWPQPIVAGDKVLIYGRLQGPDQAYKTIRLYHRIVGMRRFRLISVTRTDSRGRYAFFRRLGVVMTDRAWFVRGPAYTHSRTVFANVHALVTLQASAPQGTTLHPLVFSGHVVPDHPGAMVLLQVQRGSSDEWRTIDRGRLDSGSNFHISHAFRFPGARDIRAVLPADARSARGVSPAVQVTIQQAQVADFTISTDDPLVPDDQPARISGTLYMAGSTTKPDPNVLVELFQRPTTGGPWAEVQSATTDGNGGYSFTVQSTTNYVYQVRTVTSPVRSTAQLFEGVQDSVTMSGPSTGEVGQRVTFTGTVSPDKSGHVIYLQRMGADHDWDTVRVVRVQGNSTFAFSLTFQTPGTKEFRAQITGDAANVGGASQPLTVVVSPAPVSSLPGNG